MHKPYVYNPLLARPGKWVIGENLLGANYVFEAGCFQPHRSPDFVEHYQYEPPTH